MIKQIYSYFADLYNICTDYALPFLKDLIGIRDSEEKMHRNEKV